MTPEYIHLITGLTPAPSPDTNPQPPLPEEEDIIADGSAGAFEATEVISEEDLHPCSTGTSPKGKDYY